MSVHPFLGTDNCMQDVVMLIVTFLEILLMFLEGYKFPNLLLVHEALYRFFHLNDNLIG